MASSVFYDDAQAAIDWLCRAFGFEIRLKVEGDNGDIVHSELMFGEAMVMVGSTRGDQPYQKLYRTPKQLGGGITQALAFFVDDCDAQYARAVAAGAGTVREPRTDDYGDDYWTDRTCGVTDPEGHLWWFMQRVKG
jgi:uncharacterized glyoxalase superfamily protein PhnB